MMKKLFLSWFLANAKNKLGPNFKRTLLIGGALVASFLVVLVSLTVFIAFQFGSFFIDQARQLEVDQKARQVVAGSAGLAETFTPKPCFDAVAKSMNLHSILNVSLAEHFDSFRKACLASKKAKTECAGADCPSSKEASGAPEGEWL